MQNVSKALIMVGSVILGVILMATLVHVLKMGASVNKTYDETQLSYQTQAFNYKYDVYQRDDNTIMDMINLFNLAYTAMTEGNYNVGNAVTIIVKIGNKTYRVPKDLSTDVEVFYNNNFRVLSRNQIYDATNNEVISIYDLLEKNLSELGISGIGFSSSDKLSKIHIGKFAYYADKKIGNVAPGERLEDDNGTTYKYIFDCDDSSITYNKTSGRISKMEFECKLNPLWNVVSGENWDE